MTCAGWVLAAAGVLICVAGGCSRNDSQPAVAAPQPRNVVRNHDELAAAQSTQTPFVAPAPRAHYDRQLQLAAATDYPAPPEPPRLLDAPANTRPPVRYAPLSAEPLPRQHSGPTVNFVARVPIEQELPAKKLSDTESQKRDIKPSSAEPYRGIPVPKDLPGAWQGTIHLPMDEMNPEQRRAAIRQIYPQLPELPGEIIPQRSPYGHPFTLCELQELALANSPLIRQAMADVLASRGAALQAGKYPNPTMGYQGDSIGQGNTPGMQGGFVQQTIKTGGKLQLARESAERDVANAELGVGKARSDLFTQVRTGYFAVLVARENIRVMTTLARFVDRGYLIQVDRLIGGESASYEPSLMRVQSLQVRAMLLQSRNRYASAWKQLASSLGLPGLPPTDLAGSVDMPMPLLDHNAALLRILSCHTDVSTAEQTVAKSRTNLRLAEAVPVPDISAQVSVQKDYTTAPFGTIAGVQIGMPIPLWDRNRGGIMQADGQLRRAVEEPHRVRDDLTSRLADAYERYQNNRLIVDYYNHQILPDQVRIYRGIVARSVVEPETVTFTDVIAAVQGLTQSTSSYIQSLGLQWQAVVDVGGLMQVDDLFAISELQYMGCVPDLEHLCPLPCDHSCTPLPAVEYKQGDGSWPAQQPAAPAAEGAARPEEVQPLKDGRGKRSERRQ